MKVSYGYTVDDDFSGFKEGRRDIFFEFEYNLKCFNNKKYHTTTGLSDSIYIRAIFTIVYFDIHIDWPKMVLRVLLDRPTDISKGVAVKIESQYSRTFCSRCRLDA